MLGELYKYAIDNNLVVRPGFKAKNVKAYISLSADGKFIGFDFAIDKSMCPDIGSLANGTTKSNIVAEKAEVVLNLPDSNGERKRNQKNLFYMDAMRQAAEYDCLFKTAVNALENEKTFAEVVAELPKSKIKVGDIISIKVDGKPLESRSEYLEWWEEFRKSFSEKNKFDQMRCFITGENTKPVETVPPFSGLISVGGHTKGDSLICFDKDAFQSYRLKQATNAAVSEEAITGVNAALSSLLNESFSKLAGAKNIHWFSMKTEYDIIEMPNYDFGMEETEEHINNEDIQNDEEKVKADKRKIKNLYEYIFNGECCENPENRYYIMSLSGVNGRVMIRSYDEGFYTDLYNNIREWYIDLQLIKPGGKGYCKFPKLYSIYSRLLKYSDNDKKLHERIDNELSGISPRIMYSILHNSPLPDSVASKALAYIRSDIYSSADNDKSTNKNIDRISCQILKVWLNRKYRNQNKEEYCIMDKLNKESPSKAYQTGRLMAVYAVLQKEALGSVGAGVVERYYTSACTSPSLVIGKLATMAQYHLPKIQEGRKIFFNRMLQEISLKIGTAIPKTFSLEEQSEFALGYYYQNSQIYPSKSLINETEE